MDNIRKSKQKTIKYSIVVPVFNGAENIIKLHKRLVKVMNRIHTNYEVVYIDDGSRDASWEKLETLYKKDTCITAVQLNRNYGQHNAIMCGLKNSKGEYIVTIDDDLQNPPEEIPKLIREMKKGYDVVYGYPVQRKHQRYRNLGSKLIQKVFRMIFKTKGDLTAFRLLNVKHVKGIFKYERNYTFLDGLIAWEIDPNRIGYVEVKHSLRSHGSSNYKIHDLVFMTLNMLTNFSIFPLQIASIGGFLLSIAGILLAVYFFFKKIFLGIPVTGYASLIFVILIFSGVQLMTIGLIGEYIGRIHLNINHKPQYTIRNIKKR